MSTSKVALDTSQYVRINLARNTLVIQAHRDDVRIVINSAKPSVNNEAHHILRGGMPPLTLAHLDTNVWALAMTSTSSLTVTEITASGHDDYYLEVSRGKVPGARGEYAYGRVLLDNVITNNRVVSPVLNWVAPPPTGTQMEIVSTSAGDAPGGVGIRSVEITYLDVNLVEKTEIILLNGITPVLTVATDIRFIQCIVMVTYGSGKNAEGLISLQAAGGGATYEVISIGEVRCASSTKMVPAGKRLMIKALVASASSGTGSAEVEVTFATSILNGRNYIADSILIPLAGLTFQDSSTPLTLDVPIPFEAGSVAGLLVSSSAKATITVAWFGEIEDV